MQEGGVLVHLHDRGDSAKDGLVEGEVSLRINPFHIHGQHRILMVSIVALQYWGPGFKFGHGQLLH